MAAPLDVGGLLLRLALEVGGRADELDHGGAGGGPLIAPDSSVDLLAAVERHPQVASLTRSCTPARLMVSS